MVTHMKISQFREVDVENIGQRIKQARLASDKSVEKICGDVGISRTYWYAIENEKVSGSLSIEKLRKIEQALGVDLGVNFND